MAVNIIRHRRRAVLAALGAIVGAATGAASLLILNAPSASAADPPVNLGTAANFSVLAGSTVTNTGPSVLAQSLGVSPGSTAPGFPPGVVGGAIHLGDAVALTAKNDLTTAYNDAAGRTPFTNLPAELGGATLTPGVYRIGAAQLTGQLTLNAQGNPQSVFIFQIASTLITASNSSVVFINGSSSCNVFWQVGSSATLGTGTRFVGNIMASASITMNTAAKLEGRALAQTGAVTLDSNAITEPVCAQPTGTPTATPTVTPTGQPTPTGTPTGGPTDKPTVGPTDTPTGGPTDKPTGQPTETTTDVPPGKPTGQPTMGPTAGPTRTPTHRWTHRPTHRQSMLPVTGTDGGGGTPPTLAVAGIILAATGGAVLLLHRRRAIRS